MFRFSWPRFTFPTSFPGIQPEQAAWAHNAKGHTRNNSNSARIESIRRARNNRLTSRGSLYFCLFVEERMPAGLGNVSTFFFFFIPYFLQWLFFFSCTTLYEKICSRKTAKRHTIQTRRGPYKASPTFEIAAVLFCFKSPEKGVPFLFCFLSFWFFFFLPHVQDAPCASFRE